MPRLPPPEVPFERYPSPQVADRVLVEWVNTQKADYTPLNPGQPHPKVREYPGHVFLTQQATDDGRWVIRYFCNTLAPQDGYNSSVAYADESVSTPIYPRVYLLRRLEYLGTSPPAKLSTLTGVIGVRLTAAGQNFTSAPVVAFTGGAGSGAAAIALIFRGEVVGIVITAEGTGYTSAPTVSITGGGGSDATATALIQPSGAKLVKEKADRMEGDIHESLYIRVTRIYQTVPGVEVLSKVYTDRGTLSTDLSQTVTTGTAADVPALLDVESAVVAEDSVLSKRRKKTLAGVSTHTSHKQIPGNRLLKRQEIFPVAPSTKPSGGDLVIKDAVEAVKDHQSRRIIETVVDSAGNGIADDTGYTVWKFDPLRQVFIYTTFTIVPRGTEGPPRGSSYTFAGVTGFVDDSWVKEIDDSDNIILAVKWTTIPLPRSELKPFGVSLPAIVAFTGMAYDTDDAFPPPYYGNGVDLNTVAILRHRSLTLPAKVIYSYHYGPSSTVPPVFRVISFTSRFLPLRDNTIHPAIRITRTDTGAVVEDIPASYPESWDPNGVYVGRVSEVHWMANIWERETWLYSENLSPGQFGIYYAGQVFKATQQNDILVQPSPSGEILYLSSASGSEATVVTIYGRLKGALVEKKLTLSGTTELSTSPKEFDRVRHLRAHDDPEGIITLRGGGTQAAGFVEFVSTPATGNQLTVGKSGAETTYSFRQPARATITNVAKASHVQGESVTVTLFAVNHQLWFSLDGSDTSIPSAPVAPDTLTKVDLTSATTDDDVAAVLRTAAASLTTIFIATVANEVVTLVSIPLGAISLADTVVNAGFTTAVIEAGSNIASNQVRTGFNTAGAAISLAELGTNLVAAMNKTGTNADGLWQNVSVIHPSLTATADTDNGARVELDDYTHAAEAQVWTLSQTGTSMTLTAFVNGAGGPIIAQLNPANPAPYNRHAYRDVILSAPEILEGSPENAEPNVPATVNLTSDPMLSPVAAGAKLRLAARGGPALPVSYQVLKSLAVTITIASPGVVSWTAHGLENGNDVTLATTGALPTGLSPATTYYVVNKTANNFQLALTAGGSAINTSGTQSGIHTASAWDDGAATLPNIGGGSVYLIELPETTLGFIRVKVNNLAGEEPRAVHAELVYAIL